MLRQFMRANEIAKETGLSIGHVRRMVKEMRDFPDRYPDTDFFGIDGVQSVRLVSVQDYMRYKALLRAEVPVPDLDRDAMERELGIGPFAMRIEMRLTDEEMRRMAAQIVKTMGESFRATT